MNKYNDFKNFIDNFIEKVQSHLNSSEEKKKRIQKNRQRDKKFIKTIAKFK